MTGTPIRLGLVPKTSRPEPVSSEMLSAALAELRLVDRLEEPSVLTKRLAVTPENVIVPEEARPVAPETAPLPEISSEGVSSRLVKPPAAAMIWMAAATAVSASELSMSSKASVEPVLAALSRYRPYWVPEVEALLTVSVVELTEAVPEKAWSMVSKLSLSRLMSRALVELGLKVWPPSQAKLASSLTRSWSETISKVEPDRLISKASPLTAKQLPARTDSSMSKVTRSLPLSPVITMLVPVRAISKVSLEVSATGLEPAGVVMVSKELMLPPVVSRSVIVPFWHFFKRPSLELAQTAYRPAPQVGLEASSVHSR